MTEEKKDNKIKHIAQYVQSFAGLPLHKSRWHNPQHCIANSHKTKQYEHLPMQSDKQSNIHIPATQTGHRTV